MSDPARELERWKHERKEADAAPADIIETGKRYIEHGFSAERLGELGEQFVQTQPAWRVNAERKEWVERCLSPAYRVDRLWRWVVEHDHTMSRDEACAVIALVWSIGVEDKSKLPSPLRQAPIFSSNWLVDPGGFEPSFMWCNGSESANKLPADLKETESAYIYPGWSYVGAITKASRRARDVIENTMQPEFDLRSLIAKLNRTQRDILKQVALANRRMEPITFDGLVSHTKARNRSMIENGLKGLKKLGLRPVNLKNAAGYSLQGKALLVAEELLRLDT